VSFPLSSWQLAPVVFARRRRDGGARRSALNNRVPGAVLALEVVTAAVALGLLAPQRLDPRPRRRPGARRAALVSVLLLVTFNLDRPTRGPIKAQAKSLVAERGPMELPVGRERALSGPPGLDYPRAVAATRAIRDEAELRELVGLPSDLVVSKIADRLNDLTRQFVERSPFVCVATASRDGGLDVSPRGDPQGFVRILDEQTLLIPDRPGNRIADTLTNLLSDPGSRSCS
jgi:hypothetical protein